jgi:hypothetical protein
MVKARALVLVLAAHGCVERGPFACADASECRRDDEAGICAAPGFCAYADDACPSGHRFSDLAGGGLADRCTDDDDATTSSTGGESTSDPSESSSDSGTPAGEIAWSVLVPIGDAVPEVAWDVVALASGDPIVVGGVYGGMGSDVPQTAWAGRLSIDDGTLAWAWTSTGVWEQAFANAVALDADNVIAIGGWALDAGDIAWVATVTPTGELDWNVTIEGNGVNALVGNVEGFVAVGAVGDALDHEGNVVALGQDGGERWSHASGLPGVDMYLDVASGGFDRVFAAAQADDDIALSRAEPGGVATVATFGGAFGDHDGPQGVATHPSGDLVIAGFETSAFGHDLWLARVSPTGAEIWAARPPVSASAVDEEFEDVAVDLAGNVWAAGFVTNDDKDAMVRKFTADGEELWERTYASELAGDDTARGVAVVQDGVVIVGERPSADGTSDLWVARVVD